LPEYLTPGVYTEEIENGPGSLLSLSTSTTGFAGLTERGPISPRLVTSMNSFMKLYGGYIENSYLAYSVRGFFENGGENKRCFIARIASIKDGTANKSISIGTNNLKIQAIGPGRWGGRIYYKCEPASSKPGLFKLTLIYFEDGEAPVSKETFKDRYGGTSSTLEFVPDPTNPFIRNFLKGKKERYIVDGPHNDLSLLHSSRNYYKTEINGVSNLVLISDDISSASAPIEALPFTKFKVTHWTDILTEPDKTNLLDFLGAYFADWMAKATVAKESSNINIVNMIKEGASEPAAIIEYNPENSTLALKIGGRLVYQFLVDKDTPKLDVFAYNIEPLDFDKKSTGELVDDNVVSISDYQGIKHSVWDPDDNTVDPLNNTNKIEYTGLQAFEQIDEISLVCAPDQASDSTSEIKNAIIDHCEKMKDRFAILQATRLQSNTIDTFTIDRESKFAAIYAPWIWVSDPLTKSGKGNILIPPGGHIAGIYARSDEIGVHKAPANEVVHGANNLQIQFSSEDQAIANPNGICFIRFFPGQGIKVWGARTISYDPSWIYINTRRVIAHVFKTARRSLVHFVFMPNNERLWARIVRTITPPLTGLRLSGALMGTKDEDAFKIRCDRTTMTQDDIDNGRLIVNIALALTKPAEFVILRVAQSRESATIEELGGM